jgi:hypothetical protein
LYVHVVAPGANGDAVVTVADPRVVDADALGVLDVDAVGVGAVGRRADVEPVDTHVAAAVEPEVELRAVLHPQALHHQVPAHEEPQQLHTHRHTYQ